jgi:hypothetical protein
MVKIGRNWKMMTTAIRGGSVVTLLLWMGGVACAAETAAAPGAGNASKSGNSVPLGSAIGDITKMPDLFTGTWGTMAGFVEDNEKLVPPFTPKAQKYVDAYQHKRDIPYAEDGCRTPGLPLAMRIGGGLKFSYSPGLISIYMGTMGNTRFIRMNQPMGPTSPRYYGNSVGHWEGDTLVVETADFVPEVTFQYGVGKPLPDADTVGTVGLGPPPGTRRGGGPGGAFGAAGPGGPGPGAAGPGGPGRGGPPRGVPGEPVGSLAALSAAIWGPHGDNMHMLERMRYVSPDTLVIKTTVYDDTVWTKPYEMATRTYTRRSGEPTEWICTVSITAFDPETNSYTDKSPEEMVKFLDRLGR